VLRLNAVAAEEMLCLRFKLIVVSLLDICVVLALELNVVELIWLSCLFEELRVGLWDEASALEVQIAVLGVDVRIGRGKPIDSACTVNHFLLFLESFRLPLDHLR